MTRSSDFVSGYLYFPGGIIFFQDVYFIGRGARHYQRCTNSDGCTSPIIVAHATYTLCGWS